MRKLDSDGNTVLVSQRISRRTFVKTAAGFALAGLAGVTGYSFEMEPVSVRVEQSKVRFPGREGVPHGLRIVQLTDIHRSSLVHDSYIKKCTSAAVGLKPDIILLTGDYVTHGEGFDKGFAGLFEPLKAPLGTYAVFGNHDGGRWARLRGGLKTTRAISNAFHEVGIHTLVNETVKVPYKNGTFTIVGFGDLYARQFKPNEAYAGVDEDSFTIALSHNPDTVSRLVKHGYTFDLMFCGHTHGGQVNIPFIGPPVVPVNDRRFIAGLHKISRGYVYTSRGIGMVLGMRFNCPPEITLFEVI